MQNRELRRAQAELDAARTRYFDLYDLAPVGYLTLSQAGLIQEANLTAATLLGVGRAGLVKQPISRFILKDDQDRYYRYRKHLLEIGPAPACELRVLKKDGTQFWVQLTATLALDAAAGPEFRLVLSDITKRKRAEDDLRQLSLQLSRAEEAERCRIARELHDSTGQKLAALNMTIGLLQDATGATAGKTERMYADCLTMIDQCAQEVRTLSYLLHPPLLDELGLADAIRDYVEGFSKRSGVQVTLEVPPSLEQWSPEAELTLFRIVQESLGNIRRHAGATAGCIRLACDAEQVTLEVSDQGRGMSAATIRDIEAGRGMAGVGMAGMRERLRLMGGRLEIESGEHGTTVRAILPRREEER